MTKQKDFILNVFCFVKQNIQNKAANTENNQTPVFFI